MKKIYRYAELDDLVNELSRWRDLYDIGITGLHGQPIHAGHIDLIEDANKQCGILIVALNSDESSIRKSGYSFMLWHHRSRILASLSTVDFIIENPYDTMIELLDQLPAKRYFKGGDVNESNLLQSEKDACLANGIEIVYGTGGEKVASSRDILKDYKEYILDEYRDSHDWLGEDQ